MKAKPLRPRRVRLHTRDERAGRLPAASVVAQLKEPERVLDIRGPIDCEDDNASAPFEPMSKARLDQQVDDDSRQDDVSFRIKMNVPDLLFPEVEVGAVDLAVVSK
jgi:hypothetical protein